MSFNWTLKKWLAVNRDIYRASDLQVLLKDKAGVYLSLQSVSALMNGTPSALRIDTMQALCNALDAELHEFCSITPDVEQSRAETKKVVGEVKRLYGKTPPSSDQTDEDDFPSPLDFKPPKEIPSDD